jgi:hypothetical protein
MQYIIIALFALVATASADPEGQSCSVPYLGKCCPQTGVCPSSSCVANGLGSNEVNCNGNRCPNQSCVKSSFNGACSGKCLGRVACTSPGCQNEGQVCFYDGSSNNFKVCKGVQDCVVSEWGSFGPCVGGFKKRTRIVVTPSLNGGVACPILEDELPCNPLLDNSGCGPQLLVHYCTLDTSQSSTVCVLPNDLGSVTVPTVAGYTRMRFRITARGEYKP